MDDFDKSQKEYRRKERKENILMIFASIIAAGIIVFLTICLVLNWSPQ